MRRPMRIVAPLTLALAACGGDTLHGLKNQPPVADAGHDLSSVVGEQIRFDGSKSHDPDGSIATFAWTFGDGGSASGQVVTHAYAAAGAYAVKLTVTDDEGAKGSATIHATITKPDAPPVAVIQVSSNAVHPGDVVTFDASGSTDDGRVVSYSWDFGDGASAGAAQATHAYANEGAFTAKLTVTDDAGLTGEAETTIRVQAPPPQAIFPATYDYTADASQSSQCFGFEADPLTFTMTPNQPGPATSSCSIQEGSGFLSATYSGSYTASTRHFSATDNSAGGAQTMDGTFAADFKSFDGTYSGGSCPAGLLVAIHGTRTNPP